MTYRNVILLGDVREKLREMPAESVHCVVTSPPYWGLRDYSVAGQLGLEATPEEYVATMVDVFREVRRVLRKDGTCWVNLGDSYASGGSAAVSNTSHNGGVWKAEGHNDGFRNSEKYQGQPSPNTLAPGLKPKDLVGIPWRVALALQADGWWLRSDIIWAKPNPMPESVTDRPTKSHEYIFLLTKSAKYFYDAEAVRETAEYGRREHTGEMRSMAQDGHRSTTGTTKGADPSAGRNARTVWTIATEAYAEAHFATYPTELVKRCIQAGTSEHGCCSVCGAPWRRVVEKTFIKEANRLPGRKAHSGGMADINSYEAMGHNDVRTTGWQPSCKHEAPVEPCLVLDPFMGAGTTAIAAWRAARDYVGIELNPEYLAMAEARLAESKQQGRLL